MSAIGFLHTAEGHVETFGALVEDIDPGRPHVHAVRPDLLVRAQLHGVTLLDAPCFDAWARFEQGNTEAYHRDIAAWVDALDATIDVVVLAQASMAGAASLVESDRVVLTSPGIAVQAAFTLAAARDREASQ